MGRIGKKNSYHIKYDDMYGYGYYDRYGYGYVNTIGMGMGITQKYLLILNP